MPKLNQLFSERREEIGVEYGADTSCARLIGPPASADGNGVNPDGTDNNGDSGDSASGMVIDLSLLDEEDPRQLMMKLMLGCGAFVGFRGVKEHTNLRPKNLAREPFPPGHPLFGEEFWAFRFMEDKTTKLSVHNPVLSYHNGMKIPVNSDFGQFMQRYTKQLSPHQDRMYCLPATKAQKNEFAMRGFPKAVFLPRQPIGRHKIFKMIKEGLEKIGLPGRTGHDLRRLFVTTLANDPGVNTKEMLEATRHKSVAASRPYMLCNGKSELSKFKALGLKK